MTVSTFIRLFRRRLLLCAGLALALAPALAAQHLTPIRIGVPHKVFSLDYLLVNQLRLYLEARLKHPVEMVVHGRFNSRTAEMHQSKLDFAWVTDHPDPQFKEFIRLLAVPLYQGRPFATSHLIVAVANVRTTSLLQLRGANVALSDRDPNGTYLDLRHQLLMANENPSRFFGKLFFTRSHKDVIRAVALGLAHAGALDSRVWDLMVATQPLMTAQTRIIATSAPYGAPPLIASRDVPQPVFAAVQQVLLGMATDPEGKTLLQRMHLDGFVAGDEKLFESLVQMRRALDIQ